RLGKLPASWFHLCAASALEKGPVTQLLFGRSYVGFCTQSGRAAVLSGRCSHMGANLACGNVSGDALVCPLHGWEFGPDGLCKKIPGSDTIPAFARQSSYPVAERGGHIFFFNRKEPEYPMPFFDGVEPNEILAAEPFELRAEVPWYF